MKIKHPIDYCYQSSHSEAVDPFSMDAAKVSQKCGVKWVKNDWKRTKPKVEAKECAEQGS